MIQPFLNSLVYKLRYIYVAFLIIFIQQPEFQQILEKARDLKIMEYSDIKDQEGHQYNVFHRRDGGVPRKPTFGVKLSAYRDEYSEVDDIGSFIGSMVSTIRHDGDNEFLINNPDYQKLICFIDADKDFKWLNFKMTPERQQQLFLLGAKKAIKFLEDFNWPKYKELRSS